MNIFRLAGDMTHLLSIMVLLLKIHATRSCRGISPSRRIGPPQCTFATYLKYKLIAVLCVVKCPASTVVAVSLSCLTWLGAFIEAHIRCRDLTADARAIRPCLHLPLFGHLHALHLTVRRPILPELLVFSSACCGSTVLHPKGSSSSCMQVYCAGTTQA